MNDIQKRILNFAIAQIEIDSTPTLALCHDDCKWYSWFQMRLMTVEMTGDTEVAEELVKMQCLN